MGKRQSITWVLVSIFLIVAIPVVYSKLYKSLSRIVIKRAFVSSEVVGVSPSYVTGMVTKMYVRAGDKVKRGQLIALIDDTLYKAEVEKKLSELNSLKTELNQIDVNSDPNRYAILKQELDVFQKDVKLSKLMLSYTRVASPVDGVIAQDMVHVGDTVSPTTVMVYIYDPSKIYVRAYIKPELLNYVKEGENVKIYDPQNGIMFDGVIEKIGGIRLFSVCNTRPQIPVRIKVKSNSKIHFGEPVFVYIKR